MWDLLIVGLFVEASTLEVGMEVTRPAWLVVTGQDVDESSPSVVGADDVTSVVTLVVASVDL